MKTSNNSECAGKNNASISVKSESMKENEQLQFHPPSENATSNANKRPISLDLKNTTRKQRLVTPSLIIGSPDNQTVKPLTTTTPDLEKILHLLPTPQPGLIFQAKATSVTSEQEAFGKGFEEALHSLRNNNNKQNLVDNSNCNISVGLATQPSTTIAMGMSGGSFTYTNLGTHEEQNMYKIFFISRFLKNFNYYFY